MTNKELVVRLELLKDCAKPARKIATGEYETLVEGVNIGNYVWTLENAIKKIKEAEND